MKNKKNYMEDCVPKLVGEGKSPEESVAICSSMFETKGSDMVIPVEVEKEISLIGKLTPEGFALVTFEDEDEVTEKISFTELFAAFGCDPEKTYEFEISVTECD